MIAVLPFKKLTVNTEQSSQKFTADRKCINIVLFIPPPAIEIFEVREFSVWFSEAAIVIVAFPLPLSGVAAIKSFCII